MSYMYPYETFRPHTYAESNEIKAPKGGWSSLIGIVTALIGNILISFALNTQRYAHLRLEKEERGTKEDEEGGQLDRAGSQKQNGYGTIHEQDDDEHDTTDNDARNENDPLIKSSQSQHSQSSDETEHQDEKNSDSNKRKSYLRSPYWWIGIVLMVVGEAGNFLAYGFAPASIVSPLGVVALISNCLIAPIMLKEKFRKRDLLGVAIAVGGAVTVVLSAEGSNPKLGPEEIWDLIRHWEFETYLGITLFCILVLMVASNMYGEKTIMIDIGLVGLFGGYTALSTKGVASLLSSELYKVFTYWITYVLVAVLVITAVMQIKYVNRALQRFNATQVIPTQFVTFTISVVVGSAILYRDFENTTTTKVVQFLGGVALTFLGVLIITTGRNNDSGAGSQDEQDEDQGQINLVDNEGQQNELTTAQAPRTPTQESQNAADWHTPTSHGSKDKTNIQDTPASFVSASSEFQETPETRNKRPRLHGTETSPGPRQKRRSQQYAKAPLDSTSLLPQTPLDPKRLSASVPRPSPYTLGTQSYQTPREHSSTLRASPAAKRSSIVDGLFPGPYISPLSAGLSVVVADTRRRGIPTTDALRRTISNRQTLTTSSRNSVPDLTNPFISSSTPLSGTNGRRPTRRSVGTADALVAGREVAGGGAATANKAASERTLQLPPVDGPGMVGDLPLTTSTTAMERPNLERSAHTVEYAGNDSHVDDTEYIPSGPASTVSLTTDESLSKPNSDAGGPSNARITTTHMAASYDDSWDGGFGLGK